MITLLGLNAQWILTAAHCFTYIKSPNDVTIQYGTNELNPLEGQFKEVQEIIKHPGYNPTITIHDIALIKLKSSIPLKGHTQKVKLMDDFKQSYSNITAILIGWGLNETFGSLSTQLQRASMDTLTLADCRKQLNSVVHQTNLCAGGNNIGQCSGDSGGPLMYENKQIALVSWSLKPCASRPGVFTNIRYYLTWIRDNVEQ